MRAKLWWSRHSDRSPLGANRECCQYSDSSFVPCRLANEYSANSNHDATSQIQITEWPSMSTGIRRWAVAKCEKQKKLIRMKMANDRIRLHRLHFRQYNPSHVVPMRTHSISNRHLRRLCCDRPCVRPMWPLCAHRAEHFYGKQCPFAEFQSNFAAIANSQVLCPRAAMAFGIQTQCDWPCWHRDARNNFDRLFGICQCRGNIPISWCHYMSREYPCTPCPKWFERWTELALKMRIIHIYWFIKNETSIVSPNNYDDFTGHLPMSPPIKKQITWHISKLTTRIVNFRPLKFSKIVPAIFLSFTIHNRLVK